MDALFLDHYERELAYLRELGGEFASQYPTLAGQLGMNEFACHDPFVERLLEGFAFLSARVHRRLDAEYPELTRSLFESVYPHYTRPIPSAAVFQLQPNLQEGSLVEGYRVPKGSRLFAKPAAGQQTPCRFDTAWDTTLWPIQITEANVFSRDAAAGFPVPKEFHLPYVRSGLELTLESPNAIPLNKLKLDSLTIHLRGGEMASRLLETLLAHTVVLAGASQPTSGEPSSGDWQLLEPRQLQHVGLEPTENLLPAHPQSFSGYALLQEYFLLPERFLFVKLDGLQSLLKNTSGSRVKLLFGFDSHSQECVGRVSAEHFALHCVPGVNLFKRRADRVHLDHTKHEHHLVSDRSRPLDFEIWSIAELNGHRAATTEEIPFLPLYAPPTSDASRQRHGTYYAADRRPRLIPENSPRGQRSSYLGSEIFVSLTDSHQEPLRQDVKQLSSIVYCTNRDLPLLQPEGGWRTAFSIEAGGPVDRVLCLTGPTAPRSPLVSDNGEVAWRLVSHLTPNYLSFTDNAAGGAAMLRELLTLYCQPDDRSSLNRIEGITSIRHQQVVRRVPLPGPITYARGLELTIDCDEQAFGGGHAFLLGTILDQFFARFVTINSFTETHVESRQRGLIASWPARFGTSPLL